MIGSILAAQEVQAQGPVRDPRLMLAKSDFDRYLDALIKAGGGNDFRALQDQRVAELEELRARIKVT